MKKRASVLIGDSLVIFGDYAIAAKYQRRDGIVIATVRVTNNRTGKKTSKRFTSATENNIERAFAWFTDFQLMPAKQRPV